MNDIPQATIDSYQQGGTLYNAALAKWGQTVADNLAVAAATGDQATLNQAFANNTTGGTLYSQNQTSTADILYNQLTTDPLAAPLSDASTLAVNSVGDVQSFLSKGLSSLIQNPLTLALTVVVIAGVVVAVIGLPASKKLVGLK